MSAARRAKLSFAVETHEAMDAARRKWLMVGARISRHANPTPNERVPMILAEREYIRAFRATRACAQLPSNRRG